MGWRVRATGKSHHTSDKEVKFEVPMNLLSGLQEIADPGTGVAIPVTKSGIIHIVTGGSGETNTLANPTFAGQILILNCMTKGAGARVITVADPHFSGTPYNTITTAAAGNALILLGVKTSTTAFRWMLVANDGFTLTHV